MYAQPVGTTLRSRRLALVGRRLFAEDVVAAAPGAAPAAAGLAAPFAGFFSVLGSAIADSEGKGRQDKRPPTGLSLYLLLAYFLAAAFLRPATVFLVPRLVRALVLVRCPRTGRFRRWRTPR